MMLEHLFMADFDFSIIAKLCMIIGHLLHKKEILLKEHSHFTNSHIIIKRNAIHEWRNQTH